MSLEAYIALVVVYGGILLAIYWRVRAHVHPSRSTLLAFVATVGFMLVVTLIAFLTTTAVLFAMGVHPRMVRPDQQGMVQIGSACIFGAVIGAWYVARSHIRKPGRAAFQR